MRIKPTLLSAAVLLALLPLSACGKEDDKAKTDATDTPDTEDVEKAVEEATEDQ